jgi:hypothetical protein
MYYNTNKESGFELVESQHKSFKQEQVVLDFFRNHLEEYTPFEVHARIPVLQKSPVTSVRRSITDLTDQGYLEKTPIMRKGLYGKANHTWMLKHVNLHQSK